MTLSTVWWQSFEFNLPSEGFSALFFLGEKNSCNENLDDFFLILENIGPPAPCFLYSSNGRQHTAKITKYQEELVH